ncbi:MAG: site-specific integrase [Candidatus Thermoplasmatota archaeon]|nr:site-specific integrase [Candidatus Thermoplasmatota archaeon]
MCFRKAGGTSKKWLYQIEIFIKDYLESCKWKVSKEKTLLYCNRIQKKYCVASYRKRLLQIRLFLRHLNIDWLDKLKIVGEPEYIPMRVTISDIEKTLEYFKNNTYNKQIWAIVLLGASSGLRAEELYQLTPKDIDINSRTVYVRHNPSNNQTTKTKRSRVSFFDVEAQRALESFIGQFNKERRLKSLFSASHISRLFRKAPIKVKDLRKYFSQTWTKRGGDFAVKEILMGHSIKGNIDLSHYLYLDEEELKKIYDKTIL